MNDTYRVAGTERFQFGENWLRFLRVVNEERIEAAMRALSNMLGDMRGKSFLDVGCGSGLSSLAAHRLGAHVHAFDYDLQSVACAKELQSRFGNQWIVEEGSALDANYLSGLGQFDIVYSWGVLHHTGDMHRALTNMVPLVGPEGTLFIAIYNDQGWKSLAWREVKRAYNKSAIARGLLLSIYAPIVTAVRFLFRAFRGRVNPGRGMSIWYDAIDWLGGYPFEVATPEAITAIYSEHGFSPHRITRVGRKMGCNEYIFLRNSEENR